MASHGFNELGLACDIFENGVKKGLLQSEKGRDALVRTSETRHIPSMTSFPGYFE